MDTTRVVRAARPERKSMPAKSSPLAGEVTRVVRAVRPEREAVPAGSPSLADEATTRVGRAARVGKQPMKPPPSFEDTTLVSRVARSDRKALPERTPPRSEASPRERRAAPRMSAPAPLALERLVLVALVLGRERAAELLEGLGEQSAERAKEQLSRFAALASAQRQARVAMEFGVVDEAAERLRALMEEASEPLRQEIFRRLPPYHRSLFPKRTVEPPGAAATPALCALAERLIREATR